MADIFISYSQKDRDRVAPLVEALTAEGYDVWWDPRIRAGQPMDELIETTLAQVPCVVGVWSSHSVKSKWVRAESGWAYDRGVFVSVRIDDDAPLPIKFYNVHTPSLAAWDGSRTDAAYESTLRNIRALAGVPQSTRDAKSGGAAPEGHEGSAPPTDVGVPAKRRAIQPVLDGRSAPKAELPSADAVSPTEPETGNASPGGSRGAAPRAEKSPRAAQ